MSDDFVGLDNLNNSIGPMTSSDWKQRFIAEYAQLLTRKNKLIDTVWADDDVNSVLDCPVSLLDMQIEAMDNYQRILEIRAELYNINIEEEIEKLNR